MNNFVATADNCNDGDMRLVNGTTVAEGRVELCYNNRWGTVCDNRWTKNSTAVACRHVGFSEIADRELNISSMVATSMIKNYLL